MCSDRPQRRMQGAAGTARAAAGLAPLQRALRHAALRCACSAGQRGQALPMPPGLVRRQRHVPSPERTHQPGGPGAASGCAGIASMAARHGQACAGSPRNKACRAPHQQAQGRCSSGLRRHPQAPLAGSGSPCRRAAHEPRACRACAPLAAAAAGRVPPGAAQASPAHLPGPRTSPAAAGGPAAPPPAQTGAAAPQLRAPPRRGAPPAGRRAHRLRAPCGGVPMVCSLQPSRAARTLKPAT